MKTCELRGVGYMKNPMKNRRLLLLCLGMAMSGCQRSADVASDAWVAKVNGRKISAEEFEHTLTKISHVLSKDYSQLDSRKEVVKDLIDKELLFQEALKEKIHEKSILLKDQIVQEYLREKIGKANFMPSESEIKRAYEEKKDDLDKVRASHILIKPKTQGDAKSEAEAKSRAEKLHDAIKAKGDKANFAELAKLYSEDAGSKTQGGDLMFFKKKDMVPEFSDAAFSLRKVGDLSGVVKTAFGYHIIKLTGDQRGLEQLKPQIIHFLTKQKQKERADQLLADLRSSARIKMNDETIGASAPPADDAKKR